MNMTTKKVVLITGAARRIGAAIARHLHGCGMNVMIHYHQSELEAQTLVAELNQIRVDSAQLVTADLNQISTLTAAVEKTAACWGRLDMLINNASSFYPTPMGSATEQQWDDLLGSNLKAAFFLSQAAASELRKHKGGIINITDIHAQRPLKNYPVYSIAKAGLSMLTKVLAKELAPDIRVNEIAPGPILFPEGENKLSETQKTDLIERTALKRCGDPQEIAKAVSYLMDASFVTGQVIAVDGGRLLQL